MRKRGTCLQSNRIRGRTIDTPIFRRQHLRNLTHHLIGRLINILAGNLLPLGFQHHRFTIRNGRPATQLLQRILTAPDRHRQTGTPVRSAIIPIPAWALAIVRVRLRVPSGKMTRIFPFLSCSSAVRRACRSPSPRLTGNGPRKRTSQASLL